MDTKENEKGDFQYMDSIFPTKEARFFKGKVRVPLQIFCYPRFNHINSNNYHI